ncbi:MAG: ABC transporter permease [Actinomycetota bacterium]
MISAERPPAELRVISTRRSLRVHLSEIWQYRELLVGLIRKELKVRYKNSVLGFAWSMIQPAFLLAVYSLVFSILGAGFKSFAIWLLCGLIVWTLISTALATATQSVTANQHLVSKVPFPRAVLPLATLGSALVHFVLQFFTFGMILLITWHAVDVRYLWLLPIAVLVTTVLLAGMALLLAAVNVYARDTQHLLDLALIALFWCQPILYQYARASVWFQSRGWPSGMMLLNPFTSIIITFQRAIYGMSSVDGKALLPEGSPWWYLRNLIVVGAFGVALLVLALRLFDRAEGNFAEAL